MDMAMPQVVFAEACEDACAPATCVATPRHVDASASAPASPPLELPPSVEAPRHARQSAPAVILLRWSIRPAPGFPAPVYIRFGRFLA